MAVGFFIFLIILFGSALIVRSFIVVLHESGHAIPALLFAKDTVTVHIGSYGERTNDKAFNIGRLAFHFTKNPLLWALRGQCSSPKGMQRLQQIMFVIAGPIFPLLVASSFCFIVLHQNLNGDFYFISILINFFSVIELYNFFPRTINYKGRIILNDGKLLVMLLKSKELKGDLKYAYESFNKKEYLIAVSYFERVIESGVRDAATFRLYAAANVEVKNYEKAKQIFETIDKEFQLDSNDYCNIGVIYSKSNNHDEALKYYSKSLELNPNNSYSLNNRGYGYLILENYSEALKDLNKSIELNPSFAYAYSNRGLIKLKLGNSEEGLADINHSLTLDDKNAYAYRNLGIYYFDKREFEKALKQFQKAKELDAVTYQINFYLEETQKALSKSSGE